MSLSLADATSPRARDTASHGHVVWEWRGVAGRTERLRALRQEQGRKLGTAPLFTAPSSAGEPITAASGTAFERGRRRLDAFGSAGSSTTHSEFIASSFKYITQH